MRPPLLAVVLALTLAAVTPVSLAAAGPVHVRTASGAAGDIVVEVQIDPDQLPLVKQSAGGQTFTQITLGEGLSGAKAGTPDVPVVRRLLAVDPNQHYQVQVLLEGRTTIDDVLLFPAQPDRLDKGGKPPLLFDPGAYKTDRELGSETLVLGQAGLIGPVTVLPLAITPVHYNPARRQLTIWRKVTARVRGDGGAWRLAAAGSALTPFQAVQVHALVANAPAVFRAVAPAAAPRLLVVTTAALLDRAHELTANGRLAAYDVEFQTLPPAAGAGAVKDLVAANYAKGNLDSVLLFGDESQVPLYYWNAATPGDWYYSLVSGSDNYVDVGLGRLPVSDDDEAATILAKLAAFERLQRRRAVNRNVLLVAHQEEFPGKYTANQEKVRTAANPRGLHFSTQYAGAGATNASALAELAKGYALISYRGHGDDTSWYDWDAQGQGFGPSQVHQLQNAAGDLSIFLDVACANGALQATAPSMSEELLFYRGSDNQGHGAVAVLASTVDSYTDQNDQFNGYLFNYLQTEPAADLGALVGLANNRMVRDAGGRMPENVQMYILFGDPLLKTGIK